MGTLSSDQPLVCRWRSVRRVYPIYAALAQAFDLVAPPFPDLHQLGGHLETDGIARIENWLGEMDRLIQPHQFRQMLQSTGFAKADEKLDALVRRHLEKTSREDADRDKLDFLLTQYVSVCAPPSFQARELSLEEVAQVLEPVLGECATHVPHWLEPLEEMVEQMRECDELEEFQALNVIQRGRELKASAQEKFFTSTALLVFTRFTYFVRYTLARLLAREAEAIESYLRELEARGVTELDGTVAGAPHRIEDVRELLHTLTTSKVPAYSADGPCEEMRLLRAAVERTLKREDSAPAEADQARFERLEFEIEELRCHLDQLRHECADLRAALAARDTQPATADLIDPLGLEPLAQLSLPEPEVTQATVDMPREMCNAASRDESADIHAAVAESLAYIRKSLRSISRPTGVLGVGTGTMLLTAGEIALLQSTAPSDTVAGLIETAVAMRAVLVQRCESSKTGQGVDLSPFVQMAREVLDELQRHEKLHSQPYDTISGTTRQLWSVIQQAEKTMQARPRT